MADGTSFVIASLEQTLLAASRLLEKDVNWNLHFVCGINEPSCFVIILRYMLYIYSTSIVIFLRLIFRFSYL